jgi:hypothetical protein
MSRVKTILLAALVLLSLAFLSPSLFTSGAIDRSAQPIPAVLKATSHDNAGAAKAKINIPATTAAQFILEMYGELPPRSEGFLTTSENAGVARPSVIVVPHVFLGILAPKVSRYISKSVLNI